MERGARGLGVGVFDETEVLHFDISLDHGDLGIAARYGVEYGKVVFARIQKDDVRDVVAADPVERHVAVPEEFVEDDGEAGGARCPQLCREEAGEVAAEVVDAPFVGRQRACERNGCVWHELGADGV